MKATFQIAACAAFVVLSASVATAQPALERLEQRLLGPANRADAVPRGADVAAGAEPGYLGVVTRDSKPPGEGVQVVELLRDGPADQSGLQTGDRIVRVSDVAITKMDDLAAVITGSKAGDQLLLSVVRDNQQRKLLLTLGHRPPAEQRQFEAFGRIPVPDEAAAAPPRADAADADRLPRPLPDIGLPQPAPPGGGDQARIDLLERRVAELERRLAELERLLRQRADGR